MWFQVPPRAPNQEIPQSLRLWDFLSVYAVLRTFLHFAFAKYIPEMRSKIRFLERNFASVLQVKLLPLRYAVVILGKFA